MRPRVHISRPCLRVLAKLPSCRRNPSQTLIHLWPLADSQRRPDFFPCVSPGLNKESVLRRISVLRRASILGEVHERERGHCARHHGKEDNQLPRGEASSVGRDGGVDDGQKGRVSDLGDTGLLVFSCQSLKHLLTELDSPTQPVLLKRE